MEDSTNEKLLEKLKLYSSSITQDRELMRVAATKLHSRATSLDKQIREKTLFQIRKKKDNVFQTLIELLESVDDDVTAACIAGVIHECISPRAGISRFAVLRQLIDMNASQNLMKILVQQQQPVKEVHALDLFVHELICILGQLSQKDPKFACKIRQLNALPTFNLYLKIFHQNNSRLVLPLLMVIKCVVKNGNLLSVLIKDGTTSTLEKIFLSISLSSSSKLKLLLNIFTYLSKNTQFLNRLIKISFVPIFLKIFSRWEKYTGKTRLKICNDTVTILQHVCLSKQGRNIICRENGFTPLYKFCVSCPEDKVYDRLLTKVCSIINVCLQKQELPLSSALSPVQFKLPVELKKDRYEALDSDDSDDEDDDDNMADDGNESGIEGEVDDLSDGKVLSEKHPLQDAKPANLSETTLHRRSITDLHMYRMMFVEYYFLFYNGKHNANPLHPRHDKKLSSENNDNASDDQNTAECPNNDVLPILEDLDDNIMTQRSIYYRIASKVKKVTPFVKIAYPDMMGGDGIGALQPLYTKDRKICRSDQILFASIDALSAHNYQSTLFFKRNLHKRSKLVAGVDRYISEDKLYNNIVYDLDRLLKPTTSILVQPECSPKRLSNDDETRIGIKDPYTASSTLNFESRFESGNLRKAIQVENSNNNKATAFVNYSSLGYQNYQILIGPREYDLILTPDVNSSNHCQWFYFEVSNMDNMAVYTFNIINCEKNNSLFNNGMKPIVYSVREATLGRAGWFRSGTDICYYRNGYKIPHNHKKTFLTASFGIKFPHKLDVCYVAYTFPYTYSQLMYRIRNWLCLAEKNNIYMRLDNLCTSLNKNAVPLLTISAPDAKENRIVDRELVFLTGRVHPGETNSSWVIDGSISHLISATCNAVKLRNQYVFKIVPMLNVEGVINGCHRCCLTDEDLNRKWSHPDAQLHPSIYHTKGLLDYCTRVLRKTPFIFCDFHGHSRKKNVFFFGCSNQESWLDADRNLPNIGIEHLWLPHVMENCSPAFSSELCNYRVERNRESTARVTVWREFGVRKSYTMETSYCGCDQGPYKGFHLDTNHLQEIGSDFCTALTCLYEQKKWRFEMQVKQDGNRYIYSSSSQSSSNNYVIHSKFVANSTVNIQAKFIPPESPVWNARKIATSQKKIYPIPVPAATQSTITASQTYIEDITKKGKLYRLPLRY